MISFAAALISGVITEPRSFKRATSWRFRRFKATAAVSLCSCEQMKRPKLTKRSLSSLNPPEDLTFQNVTVWKCSVISSNSWALYSSADVTQTGADCAFVWDYFPPRRDTHTQSIYCSKIVFMAVTQKYFTAAMLGDKGASFSSWKILEVCVTEE